LFDSNKKARKERAFLLALEKLATNLRWDNLNLRHSRSVLAGI
jgi:hypothetical protein